MDIATVEIERLMRKAKAEEDDKLMLYGIIRAILWSIGYILERMEKMKDKDGKPGDINEDGKEIEQDGDITWENADDSKGISETV